MDIIMKLDTLLKKKIISKIVETERQRYEMFFNNSYLENLEHSKKVMEKFPRWSMISGYYAMHDITKLFLVKTFGIKIEFKVHQTTIKILKEILKNKETLKLIEIGYGEFLKMANDLSEGKKERSKAQYYTGSEFSKDKFKKRAEEFLEKVVIPYIKKMEEIIK